MKNVYFTLINENSLVVLFEVESMEVINVLPVESYMRDRVYAIEEYVAFPAAADAMGISVDTYKWRVFPKLEDMDITYTASFRHIVERMCGWDYDDAA